MASPLKQRAYCKNTEKPAYVMAMNSVEAQQNETLGAFKNS
jgi:hypothetical protein